MQSVVLLGGDGKRYDFNEVYRENAPRLTRFLKFKITNHQTSRDVEDIIQDTFIRVYNGLGNFKGDSALYTWITTIAIRTMINHQRLLSAKMPLTLSDHHIDTEEQVSIIDNHNYDECTPERLLNSQQILLKFEEIFNSLAPSLQTALTLWLDDNPYDDIARKENIPLNTAKTRVHRARRYIEQNLKPLVNLYA